METVRIGEKYYNGEKLTDKATALLSDIAKVEGELGRLNLQTSISNLAKGTLVQNLVEEAKNLEEVEAPAAPETLENTTATKEVE